MVPGHKAGSWGMKHYFSRFRLVEIQQTFYRLPPTETAARWQELEKRGWRVVHIIDKQRSWVPKSQLKNQTR